jgi:hypothetical protein
MTIEQVPRLSTGQKGSELACSQLMEVENGNVSGLEVSKGMRVRIPNIPERQSEHEIQIDFQVARFTG